MSTESHLCEKSLMVILSSFTYRVADRFSPPVDGSLAGIPVLMVVDGAAGVTLSIITREHKDAWIKGFTDNSAIAEHAWMKDHPIRWEDTRILQHASRTMELVVKETICIRTTPESSHFNRDGDYNIPDCWITAYRKLRGGTSTGHTHPTTS